ncbi:MAG: class I SAM-dependent methyltransferase, partial [bacterium]
MSGFSVYEKHVDNIEEYKIPPGAMLDIGCAYGGILLESATRGWTTRGIEPSAEAAKFCRDNLKLDVTQEEILDASLPENAYDAIVMLEVLEHVRNPIKVMQQVSKLARPQCLLYLT